MGDMRSTYPHAGHVEAFPAIRLAGTIGTVRGVLVGIFALVTVLVTVNSASIVPVFIGLAWCLTVWIVLGWLEQVLRLLVGIAYNTAESAGIGPSTAMAGDAATD